MQRQGLVCTISATALALAVGIFVGHTINTTGKVAVASSRSVESGMVGRIKTITRVELHDVVHVRTVTRTIIRTVRVPIVHTRTIVKTVKVVVAAPTGTAMTIVTPAVPNTVPGISMTASKPLVAVDSIIPPDQRMVHIDVTITNKGVTGFHYTPYDFVLVSHPDSTQHEYDSNLTYNLLTTPDLTTGLSEDTLAPGAAVTGQIFWNVAATDKTFTLYYAPTTTGTSVLVSFK